MNRRDSKPQIQVLGGGVNGITTALFFQLSGAQTTLCTAERPDKIAQTARSSSFASLYPAASIIPHSVTSDLVDKLTRDSLVFFSRLAREKIGGVWEQPHYEVFEDPPTTVPNYATGMDHFEKLPSDGSGVDGAPRREGAKAIFGWRFRTAFAQMPTYLPWLYQLYEASGGKIVVGKQNAESFLARGGDAFISCVGLEGGMFGDDREKARVIRGHLIKVFVDTFPLKPVSYNYHPPKEVYHDAKGNPADVYCYPRREGGWALGGSRQEGIQVKDRWIGEETAGSVIYLDSIEVPEPIWTLNRQLIHSIMGIDIERFKKEAVIGFRPIRTGASSLRLEQSPLHPHLFHSGGQGGSGVTLSWGCAIELGRLVQNQLGLALDVAQMPIKESLYAAPLRVLQGIVQALQARPA